MSSRQPLATAISAKKEKLQEQIILIYGRSKIGKTTLVSKFDNVLFLATEESHRHVTVAKNTVSNWDDFLFYCNELAKGQHTYKTVAIDTVDNLYQMCRDQVFGQDHKVGQQLQKIKHESDLGFGKGFDAVLTEFKRVVNKLTRLPYGVIFISHAKDEEKDTRTGKISRIVPSVYGQGKQAILDIADIVLYCEVKMVNKTEKRVMYTKPSLFYEAGDRTGRLPEEIELDFEAFNKAYYQVTAQVTQNKETK